MQSICTAAIWRNDFGLELRVLHGDELIELRLSRFGEAPLLLIAEEVKANLIEQGWLETPDATRHTPSPMPPASSGETISYGPRRAPEISVLAADEPPPVVRPEPHRQVQSALVCRQDW
jgi:hypothetical protein